MRQDERGGLGRRVLLGVGKSNWLEIIFLKEIFFLYPNRYV